MPRQHGPRAWMWSCTYTLTKQKKTKKIQVLRFVASARAAGVDVELHVQPGMVHVFALFALLYPIGSGFTRDDSFKYEDSMCVHDDVTYVCMMM